MTVVDASKEHVVSTRGEFVRRRGENAAFQRVWNNYRNSAEKKRCGRIKL